MNSVRLPLAQLEKLLTYLSQSLDLAYGLTLPKSIKLEPWGGVAVLQPGGQWTLYGASQWNAPVDATVRWQPEQWAKIMRGAIAGWWPLSVQEGFAVEGDVAWVLELHRRFRLLPWWWASVSEKVGPFSHAAHSLARSAFKQGHMLFSAGSMMLQEALIEDRWGVSRPVAASFTTQVEALYEVVERFEARCQRLEKKAYPVQTSAFPSKSVC